MLDKASIEKILKINGVEPSSPNEVIRSVLLSARFKEEEIDTALMVLREDTVTTKTRVDGLHKIFRSDEVLKPNEIARLLGISVDVSEAEIKERRDRNLRPMHYFIVACLATVLACSVLLLCMYYLSIGPFHPTAASAFSWQNV